MSHIGPLVCWSFVALHVARRHLGALYINLEQYPHICHSASLEVDLSVPEVSLWATSLWNCEPEQSAIASNAYSSNAVTSTTQPCLPGRVCCAGLFHGCHGSYSSSQFQFSLAKGTISLDIIRYH